MEKLKNIMNLSRLFIIEDSNNYFNLIDRENRKINKKSKIFWLMIILFLAIFYISYKGITLLKRYNIGEIFLDGYFLFIGLILIIQTVNISGKLFYFSKDTEHILPLPLSSLEIFVSKFNTLMFMLYFFEIVFGIIPFFCYGLIMDMSPAFYINLIFILIIFPIFIAIFINIILIFLIKTIKFVKNKNIFQLIISSLLIFLILGFVIFQFKNIVLDEEINMNNTVDEELLENITNNKLKKLNSYFLIINPSINILQGDSFFEIFFNYFKLIFINVCAGSVLLFLGNKFYIKQLLKNSFYNKGKMYEKFNLTKKCKKRKISISYIRKEFKILFKNSYFLIENIMPVISYTIIAVFLIINLMPIVTNLYNEMDIETMEFNFEIVCIIIGLLQIVGLFNFLSVSAFSREGRDVCILKSLPIDLYKQFIYKNIPQVLLNMISSIFILGIISYKFPAIQFKYIFIMFVFNILLILINSFILCIIDLINPKINWSAEYELSKNKNKLLQLVLIVFNVLFLMYFYRIFEDLDLDIALSVFGAILLTIFVVMNLLINRYKNKLFAKII